MDVDFEWDEDKAADNYAKHKVTFATARLAFADLFAVEWFDDRFDYGEERFNMLGMAEDRLLSVTYTSVSGESALSPRGGPSPMKDADITKRQLLKCTV